MATGIVTPPTRVTPGADPATNAAIQDIYNKLNSLLNRSATVTVQGDNFKDGSGRSCSGSQTIKIAL